VKPDWSRETPEDRKAYTKWLKRRIVKAPHAMTMKCLNWMYCSRCGLLTLKNEETRKALRAGCEKDE
jgi:hypothetical protein